MSRIERKKAVAIGELLQECIRSLGLTKGLNTHRIFAAWDEASGAGGYTVRKYFRGGKLYVTLSSSVIRSRLQFQKDLILERMNEILAGDVLFNSSDKDTGTVNELILK